MKPKKITKATVVPKGTWLIHDPATDETTNLNSTERNATDKKIRKVFGEVDDFLLTSMSSQLGSLRFINEGTT